MEYSFITRPLESNITNKSFKFENPWKLGNLTFNSRKERKSRAKVAPLLAEIEFFDRVTLKQVKRVKPSMISLETLNTERAIENVRLKNIIEKFNNKWIENPEPEEVGTLTRRPKPSITTAVPVYHNVVQL